MCSYKKKKTNYANTNFYKFIKTRWNNSPWLFRVQSPALDGETRPNACGRVRFATCRTPHVIIHGNDFADARFSRRHSVFFYFSLTHSLLSTLFEALGKYVIYGDDELRTNDGIRVTGHGRDEPFLHDARAKTLRRSGWGPRCRKRERCPWNAHTHTQKTHRTIYTYIIIDRVALKTRNRRWLHTQWSFSVRFFLCSARVLTTTRGQRAADRPLIWRTRAYTRALYRKQTPCRTIFSRSVHTHSSHGTQPFESSIYPVPGVCIVSSRPTKAGKSALPFQRSGRVKTACLLYPLSSDCRNVLRQRSCRNGVIDWTVLTITRETMKYIYIYFFFLFYRDWTTFTKRFGKK